MSDWNAQPPVMFGVTLPRRFVVWCVEPFAGGRVVADVDDR